MAKSTKNTDTKSATQAPAKVAKLDKTAKPTASGQKPAKAEKAKRTTSGQQAARNVYKGRKIVVLPEGKDAKFRGGRAVRWDMVKKAKTCDDVLGATYRIEGEDADRTFNASNLHPFVDKGYIRID